MENNESAWWLEYALSALKKAAQAAKNPQQSGSSEGVVFSKDDFERLPEYLATEVNEYIRPDHITELVCGFKIENNQVEIASVQRFNFKRTKLVELLKDSFKQFLVAPDGKGFKRS